ncbi:MAG: leucyl/phenylalanyl-tRNA--protein transferase [Acidobacteria bacterium]|nr:leucyl/phenylalanyl-tRNA--protein transferase [Acidobacteriota bacterium]
MRNRKSAAKPLITPEQIIAGYWQGTFPMARGRYGNIDWYVAEPRTIIPLDERFRVRRSLRQKIRKSDYRVEINRDFGGVIRACARHDLVDDDDVWLSDQMIALYLELHRRGLAHSVEVWEEDSLIGGLYGVAIKAAFFGESMFHRAPSASHIALVALVERLRARDYRLLDVQMRTNHIGFFGAVDLTHYQYLALLAEAMLVDCQFVEK